MAISNNARELKQSLKVKELDQMEKSENEEDQNDYLSQSQPLVDSP